MHSPLDHPIAQAAFAWGTARILPSLSSDDHCPTRDVFRARVDSVRIALQRKGFPESNVPLMHAVLAEIGGNAFDHNIGKFRDMPGVFFGRTIEPSPLFVIVDRGQGILTTLKRVRPELTTDMEALRVAFFERLSSRAPENRGNGLKFVRKTLLGDEIDMFFQSGKASYSVQQKQEQWEEQSTAVFGCLAVLFFTGS